MWGKELRLFLHMFVVICQCFFHVCCTCKYIYIYYIYIHLAPPGMYETV